MNNFGLSELLGLQTRGSGWHELWNRCIDPMPAKNGERAKQGRACQLLRSDFLGSRHGISVVMRVHLDDIVLFELFGVEAGDDRESMAKA